MKKKKLKVVYEFDPKITDWQEKLDSAFDLVFRKIAQEYEGEKKTYGQKYI
ncbi:MAG: hypothetical protein AAB492_05320 [Patescibacteria group bacterium]